MTKECHIQEQTMAPSQYGKDAKLKNRAGVFLFLLVALMAGGGASCQRLMWQPQQPLPPAVLPPQPTLAQVLSVINDNRARVTTVSSNQAILSSSGVPSMRAELAIAGPRHMRLTSRTGLTGKELDLGSNHELFWIWIKRNQPPGVYFARHDAFASSPIQQSIPVRPEWLVEALGLAYLDPTLAHQGPFPRNDGRLEVHTPIDSPQGPMTKVLVIDARAGWIVEQQLLGPQREVVARAVNSRHMRDPVTGFTMPRKTHLSWPSTGMSLSLELNNVTFNTLEMNPELWSKPSYPGYPDRDLTQMAAPPVTPGQGTPVSSAPRQYR